MLRAPHENNHHPAHLYIDTVSHFKLFIDEAHQVVTKQGPTPIILDTRGSSDCWLEKRREIDGDKFYKNDESSGVTVIVMNVMVRGKRRRTQDVVGEDKLAFINVKKMIEREQGGEPKLPASFWRLLRHAKVIVIGENIVKHLKRLENSYTDRTAGILFSTFEDLTNRYLSQRQYQVDKQIWDFDLDPFINSGLLTNFHRVYPTKTFFRNPYEVDPTLWDNLEVRRISQTTHALNKVFFGAGLITDILRWFVKWDCSLSAMCQTYPECKKVSRIDFRQRDAVMSYRYPPDKVHRLCNHPEPDKRITNVWFEEVLWPITPGDTSKIGDRIPEVGEEGDPRREQEAIAKKRRRTDPYFKRSREMEVSDVSDEDDADEVVGRIREAKAATVARGKEVARVIAEDEKGAVKRICDPNDWTQLKELAKEDANDDPLFFSTILLNLDRARNHRAIRELSAFYATRAEDGQKEIVINSLGSVGFFAKTNQMTAFMMMSKMRLAHFHPTTLFQLQAPPAHIANFVAQLPDVCDRILIIRYLCAYYGLPLDERHVQIEACDWFFRPHRASYLKKDGPIVELVRALCQATNIELAEDFFVVGRHSYICEVIEHGRQGYVSVTNATRMIIAQIGEENYFDGRDGCLMAAPWPKVAELIADHYGVAGTASRVLRYDDNRAKMVQCQRGLHKIQDAESLHVMREMPEVEAMMASMADADILHLLLQENRDPRAFTIDPQFVAVSAPDKPSFAFFPISIRGEEKGVIENFLSSKTLFCRKPGFAKRYLAKPGRDLLVANGADLLQTFAGGRDNESLADFVWEKRFCSLCKFEWHTDPLTDEQRDHVVYLMDMVRAFFERIGLAAIRDVAKVLKHPEMNQ